MGRHDNFDKVLESLNDAMFDDAHWPATSALIDETCGIKGNELTVGEGSGKDVRIYMSRFCYRGQRRKDMEQTYFTQYYPADERVPRFRRLPDSKLAHVHELYTDKERRTSRTYNEALVLNDGQNALNVRLAGPDGLRIAWEFCDPVDGSGWWTDQIETIQRLLPHLRQYVRVRHALLKAEAMAASLTQLLSNSRVGVVCLDWRGRIVETNGRALDVLRRGDGLLDQGGFLRAYLPTDNARLQKLLADSLSNFGHTAVSGSMTAQRPFGNAPLVLHVVPITAGRTDMSGWPAAALVQIVEPGNLPAIDTGLVAQALGLTPAESRVAVLLAEGTAVRNIAKGLDCQENTVRYHIKQMHQKLGISRRAELVRLVISLAGSSDFRP